MMIGNWLAFVGSEIDSISTQEKTESGKSDSSKDQNNARGCSVSMGSKPQPSSVRELVGSLFTAGEWIDDKLYKVTHE